VVDAYCDLARPILPSSKSVLVDSDKRQILAHNKIWEGRCK